MRLQQTLSAFGIVVLAVTLTACGGGGGGNNPANNGNTPDAPGTGTGPASSGSLAVSTNTLVFNAANAASATPGARGITVTVSNLSGNGTLYILADSTGPAIASVTNPTGNMGTINGSNITIVGTTTATPVAPSGITPPATSTIRIRACLNDPTCNTNQLSGSPQTINVSYTLGAAAVTGIADAVTPHAITAGVAGQVVIRGQAVGSATDVRFGGTAATSVTMVSATELRVRYPALSAGSQTVTLSSSTGPMNFNGSVAAVAPVAFTGQMLTYPGTAPQRISTAFYDDERRALLVGLSFPASPADNRLVRYTRATNGTWSSAQVSVPNLRDAVLSNDGQLVIAVTDAAVLELAPDTLLTLRTVASPGPALQRLALGNDGQAFIVARGTTQPFLYSVAQRTFTSLTNISIPAQDEATATGVVATADGSHIYITESVTPAQTVLDYSASTGTFSERPLSIVHAPDQALAVDQTGSRLLPYVRAGAAQLRDGSFNALGNIPLSPLAISINRQATRAFVLDAGNMFYVFDLSVPASNGNVVQLGNSQIISTPGTDGTSIKSATAADGSVSFMAGVKGVVVIPTP